MGKYLGITLYDVYVCVSPFVNSSRFVIWILVVKILKPTTPHPDVIWSKEFVKDKGYAKYRRRSQWNKRAPTNLIELNFCLMTCH